jgi:hypothetical protein
MFGHHGFSEDRTGVSNRLILKLTLNIKSKTTMVAKLFTRMLRTLTIDTKREHIAR